MNLDPAKRLEEIFEQSLDGVLTVTVDVNNLDYYSLFCKAASKERLYKISEYNVCMFVNKYEEEDSVLILFMMPINVENGSKTKNVAERVMEVVSLLENVFVNLDFLESKEVKEDKYIYVVATKKI